MNGFNSLDTANGYLTLYTACFNFLRPHESLNRQTPVEVSEIKDCPNMPAKWIKFLHQANITKAKGVPPMSVFLTIFLLTFQGATWFQQTHPSLALVLTQKNKRMRQHQCVKRILFLVIFVIIYSHIKITLVL